MGTLYLTAQPLTGANAGYMLAVGPNPDLGISATPVSDHSYETIDELCEVIDECEALQALDVAALRISLEAEKPYHAVVSKESAACMGFKV